MELAVVPLYTVRTCVFSTRNLSIYLSLSTARPRLVRVPRTYSAWGPGASCPAPLVRTARRSGWYAYTVGCSPYVRTYSTEAAGLHWCGRVCGSGRGLTAAGSCRRSRLQNLTEATHMPQNYFPALGTRCK